MKIVSYIIAVIVLVTVFSCEKPDNNPNNVIKDGNIVGGSSISNTTQEFIRFTLGTAIYTYTAPETGLWKTSGGGLVGQPALPNYFFKSNTYHNATSMGSSPVFTVTIADSTSETVAPISTPYFRKFLQKTNRLYAASQNIPSGKSVGMFIGLKDNANVYWQTINPTNSTSFQDSFNFYIYQTGEYATATEEMVVKFKASFNCKLYNNVGDSVLLTNGEMTISFNK